MCPKWTIWFSLSNLFPSPKYSLFQQVCTILPIVQDRNMILLIFQILISDLLWSLWILPFKYISKPPSLCISSVTFLVQAAMTRRSKDELPQWFTFILPLLPCPHSIYTWHRHIKWIMPFHCNKPLNVIIPFTLWSACLTWLPNPHVVQGVNPLWLVSL